MSTLPSLLFLPRSVYDAQRRRTMVLLEARHDLPATGSAMQRSVIKQVNSGAYLWQQRLCSWCQRQTVL